MISPRELGLMISSRIRSVTLKNPAVGQRPCDREQNSGRSTQLWVQFRIIIHFELEVDTEAASPLLDFAEQITEGRGQVLNLATNHIELSGAAFAMFGWSIKTLCFLAHVIFLEGQNGQSIDHHAGRFGIERAAGIAGLQHLHKVSVDLFNKVISSLIVSVNGTFGLTDPFRAKVIAASDVFFVPEREVFKVVLPDQCQQSGFCGCGLCLMPVSGPVGVSSKDFLNVHDRYLKTGRKGGVTE